MEWRTMVNELFPDNISKVDSSLVAPGYRSGNFNHRVMEQAMTNLIDSLGRQSAEAQGLSKIITTADTMRSSPSHIIYLVKDAEANNGHGELIGMLKVGRKHLYLFDERDQMRELEPLCVLDFFVVPGRQRNGYGRMLFDYMLQDLEMSPHDMPVDGPSANMERFLAKNYLMDGMVRQSNNFSVSPFFFVEHNSNNASTSTVRNNHASGGGLAHDHDGDRASNTSRSGRDTPGSSGAVGRYTAVRPHSNIASIIHGGVGNYPEPHERLSTAERTARNYAFALAQAGEEWDRDDEDEEGAAAPAVVGGLQPRVEAERELEPAPARELQPGAPRPRSLPVAPAPPTPPPPPPPAAVAERHPSQLTDRGYFDVKYYHNKLW